MHNDNFTRVRLYGCVINACPAILNICIFTNIWIISYLNEKIISYYKLIIKKLSISLFNYKQKNNKCP